MNDEKKSETQILAPYRLLAIYLSSIVSPYRNFFNPQKTGKVQTKSPL